MSRARAARQSTRRHVAEEEDEDVVMEEEEEEEDDYEEASSKSRSRKTPGKKTDDTPKRKRGESTSATPATTSRKSRNRNAMEVDELPKPSQTIDDSEEDEGEEEEEGADGTKTKRSRGDRRADAGWSISMLPVSGAAMNTYNRMIPEEASKALNELVRWLLSCCRKHSTLSKTLAAKKLLSSDQQRAFPVILQQANRKLQQVFGLEVCELPAHAQKKSKGPSGSQAQRGTAVAASSSVSYVLRNVLPSANRAKFIPWSDKEYESMGILMIILSYIFVHNKEAEIGAVVRHLRKYGLEGRRSDIASVEEEFFGEFFKYGYLDKVRREAGGERDMVYLVWGPRAHIELSKEAVIDFIVKTCEPEANSIAKFRDEILRASGQID